MSETTPLTTEFLETTLSEGTARLQTVQWSGLGTAATYNANLWRIKLVWDRPVSHLPTSIIAKLPTDNRDLDENAEIFQPGQRENWFYNLAKRPGSPHCYYNAVDPIQNQSILLLADIHPARPLTQRDGMNANEAAAALTVLAQHHALWWNQDEHPEILALKGIIGPSSGEEALFVQDLFDSAWSQFLDFDFVQLNDEAFTYGNAFVGNIALQDEMLDRPDKTVAHGDYRADNLLMQETEMGLTCHIVDWEDCHYGTGALDVSWLLATCLDLETVAEEMALLRHYHQTIVANGVSGYEFDAFLTDYRLSLSNAFMQSVLTVTTNINRGTPDLTICLNLTRRINLMAARHALASMIS